MVPSFRRAVYRLILVPLALLSIAPVGCDSSGPTTTKTTSAALPTVAERVAFVQRYVTFRRTYETLDFDVAYQDNSGGLVPGPSDWDVRIVATVPAAELSAWVPTGTSLGPSPQDLGWLRSVPTPLDLSGVNEWYVVGGRSVGLDRGRRIVAYRSVKR